MRYGLMVLGLLVAVVFLMPAERVPAVAGDPDFVYIPNRDANGEPYKQKSGLRIAVEGRLKWLGLL